MAATCCTVAVDVSSVNLVNMQLSDQDVASFLSSSPPTPPLPLSPQHGVLSKEFVELMGHCNTIQAHYRDRNVERIQRQLKISEYMRKLVASSELRHSSVLSHDACLIWSHEEKKIAQLVDDKQSAFSSLFLKTNDHQHSSTFTVKYTEKYKMY